MEKWWLLLHLLVLSVEDILEGQLSMILILELGITGAFYAVYAGQCPSMCLGLLLLGIGFFSGEKIGYGDGFLMLALGMWMTLPELLGIFLAGVGFCILYTLCAGKKEAPLVPFLTLAYLGGWL